MSKSKVRAELGDPETIDGGASKMRWDYRFNVRCHYDENCYYEEQWTTFVFRDGHLVQVHDAPGSVIIER